MKKLIAISLTMLMLLSSVSITFATHYCGGVAVKTSLSIGHENIGCGMTGSGDSDCEKFPSDSSISKKCCENQYIQLSVEDEFSTNSSIQIPSNFDFVSSSAVTFYVQNYFPNTLIQEYFSRPPPIYKRDIQVLLQVFLI